MKHQDFRNAAIDEAFELIEGAILPSLAELIEKAAAARPGIDAEQKAEQLRALAQELETLTGFFQGSAH